ncbi:MAG TPA: DUF4350 domain-containing protein [Pyrinomonadaceae bacterium]|nr:DUF4350 domain-containing protein [Pyrinomonadaceae bacterium]
MMRQRLTIILTFLVIIGVLVILNTLTYVKQEKLQDSEMLPDRSTYHGGSTGVRALHDFLSESGYKVMRWRESPEKLWSEAGNNVATFVVVGSTRLPFSEEQVQALHSWIARGGCFVLIDRDPDPHLLPNTREWSVSSRMLDFPGFDLDPADAAAMTKDVKPLTPVQPTRYTHNVASVQASRFAGRIMVLPQEHPVITSTGEHKAVVEEPSTDDEEFEEEEPPPAIGGGIDTEESNVSRAPVVHIADGDGALLVDYAYGRGRVVLLTDPYFVANRGIRANDNLQLAINTITAYDGLIAFDEYHQGRGITRNAFASYFSGTPVLAIAGQLVLVVLLVLWTNARRFARSLPLPQVDRRSSLEFVASMAELQERSRAFDLAIENIYSRTRRVLARYAGVNYNSTRSEIASRIASRSAVDAHQLETLMRQCEDAINGEPINWRQALDLVRRLRELERKLGLRMRSRDVRQAAENI